MMDAPAPVPSLPHAEQDDMADRVVFIPEDGAVWFAGEETRLRPQAVKILENLCSHHGHWRRVQELEFVLWPAATEGMIPPSAHSVIGKAAREAAVALLGTPAAVQSRKWFGYRVVGPIDVMHV